MCLSFPSFYFLQGDDINRLYSRSSADAVTFESSALFPQFREICISRCCASVLIATKFQLNDVSGSVGLVHGCEWH